MLPLPLFSCLPTPSEMRQWEEIAITTFGIPPHILMENAGTAAFQLLQQRFSCTPKTRILLFIGGGNNGGDGAVLARLFSNVGCQVLVCHTKELHTLPEPAKQQAQTTYLTGIPFLPLGNSAHFLLPLEWMHPHLVIDALTGIGLEGQLKQQTRAIVQQINSFKGRCPIVALDIPSGLSSVKGHPLPEAVQANITICFEAGKPGLYLPPAAPYVGEVVVVPFGMPPEVRTLCPSRWNLLTPQPGASARPSPFTHKGKAGRVLIVGGSRAMAGAPVLAARAALRAGAGVVHIAMPAGLVSGMRAALPEAIFHPLGTGDDWEETMATELHTLYAHVAPHCLILGPGLGRSPASREIVKSILLVNNRCPAVLDADALYWLRLPPLPEHTALLPLHCIHNHDVLTPHPGEMARILGITEKTNPEHSAAESIQHDREAALLRATKALPCTVALKGPSTLIQQGNGPICVAPFATATLGVAGSGDILSGAIAALVAGSMDTYQASCLGVYLHGRAGELLERLAPCGHLASDIADTFPHVRQELCHAP